MKILLIISCVLTTITIVFRGFYNQAFTKVDYLLLTLSMIIVLSITCYDATEKQKK